VVQLVLMTEQQIQLVLVVEELVVRLEVFQVQEVLILVVAVVALVILTQAALAVLVLSLSVTQIHLQQPPQPVAQQLPSPVVTASILSQGLGALLSNGTLCTGKRKLDC
jgi:hypothetical protein